MKRLVMLAAVVTCLLVPVKWATADADQRAAVERKEKAIREWQNGQNQRLKAVDREAQRLLGEINRSTGSVKK